MDDKERKLLTVIQHNYRRGRLLTADEILFRSSYPWDRLWKNWIVQKQVKGDTGSAGQTRKRTRFR